MDEFVPDRKKAAALTRRVGVDFGAALTVALAFIGDRLGILKGMADDTPRTRTISLIRAQSGLTHQRQHLPSEKFKVRNVIEEIHLHTVAACPLELREPVHDLFGRADQMEVAADHPLLALVAAP